MKVFLKCRRQVKIIIWMPIYNVLDMHMYALYIRTCLVEHTLHWMALLSVQMYYTGTNESFMLSVSLLRPSD
jgi:hypothetical protein